MADRRLCVKKSSYWHLISESLENLPYLTLSENAIIQKCQIDALICALFVSYYVVGQMKGVGVFARFQTYPLIQECSLNRDSIFTVLGG